MDRPGQTDPETPARARLWSMIAATWAARGVVEGHGAGLRDLPRIDAEMRALHDAGALVDRMHEPGFHPRRAPGFPERLAFATLACAPWRRVLVAPSDHAPQGLVNVTTGETHPVVV